MGWYYLPVILLSSSLALGVALLLNNIQRRYPLWWFVPPTPIPTLARLPRPEELALAGDGNSVSAENTIVEPDMIHTKREGSSPV